jgi:hypothetical protein
MKLSVPFETSSGGSPVLAREDLEEVIRSTLVFLFDVEKRVDLGGVSITKAPAVTDHSVTEFRVGVTVWTVTPLRMRLYLDLTFMPSGFIFCELVLVPPSSIPTVRCRTVNSLTT